MEENATGIEDVITIITGGGGCGAFVEGVAVEAAGICTADGIVLGTNAVVAEWAASGVKSKVAAAAVEAMSCTCRRRTAAAAATAVIVMIPY
jgi:hypothetical protein